MAERKEEDVVTAAIQVFQRYGYKRVTMGDIAGAARMSRPALYLVFPSKEKIFSAVVKRIFTAMLDEIRQGLDRFAMAEEKLRFAFEVWCVRSFEIVLVSPDAKDLLQSSYEFATEVTTKAAADFAAILAEVLEPLVGTENRVNLSSVQVAHLLACAVLGFKESATNADELRQMIAGLVTIVLTSLNQ